MARLSLRKGKAPDYTFGGERDSEKIAREFLLARMILRLQYDWAVTGGTGAGTVFGDAHARAFPEIAVVTAGGTQPILRVSGQALRWLNLFWGEQQPYQLDPTNDTASINEDARVAQAELFFNMPWSSKPFDFLFAPWAEDNPELEVLPAAASDLITGEDGTLVLTNENLEVHYRPVFGLPMDPSLYGSIRIRQVKKSVTVTEDDFDIELGHLERIEDLRAVLIETQAGGSSGADYAYNNSVLTDLRLEVGGTTVFGPTTFERLREQNYRVYGLSALQTGAALIDAAEDKNTDDLWPVGGSTARLVGNVAKQSGDNRIILTTVAVRRAGR